MELDNPVWWALSGRQKVLGSSTGAAARFDPDVSPFGGFAGRPSASDWVDMASLTGPGRTVAIISPGGEPFPTPEDWSTSWTSPGVQMTGSPQGVSRSGSRPRRGPDDRPAPLGEADVADMLALVSLTQPGPFLSRTVEFGGYVGVRRGGVLVAMAGERLRLPGYAEISAVATHPGHRGQGLAELLISCVAGAIVDRGEVPFLHVADGNTAIRLYETLGFTVRRTVRFSVVEAPAAG